jgi:hypothetical protein
MVKFIKAMSLNAFYYTAAMLQKGKVKVRIFDFPNRVGRSPLLTNFA